MARLESQAVAGYFKTPVGQIPRIAGLLRCEAYEDDEFHRVSAMDPCAGDGEAVELLACALHEDVEFYTCEVEATRHAALVARMHAQQGRKYGHGWADANRALRGDAFRIDFKVGGESKSYLDPRGDGVSFLLLNPPYDTDPVHGRLEEKFLARFALALADGGVLVYIVPHYALKASVDTIGRLFRDVECYRFYGEDYAAYRQVVLFGTMREAPLLAPDSETVNRVLAWASSDAGILELPEPGYVPVEDRRVVHQRDCRGHSAVEGWTIKPVDVRGILGAFRPWRETPKRGGDQPVARVLPALSLHDLMHRTYETATPPRPAYIASGLAAGLFNGRRIDPDDASSGLPPLLVKGVFDREWKTVEEKVNKDGEKTAEVQVQQPKLVVTVLDLQGHRFHKVASKAEATEGLRDAGQMGVGDLLKYYGRSLGQVMERQCRVIYDPRRDAWEPLAEVARAPFRAQEHASRATVKLLRERPRQGVVLDGEVGCGKSSIILHVCKSRGARRPLVLAPPHLVAKSWPDEVAAVLPEAEIRVLRTGSDVEEVARIPRGRLVVSVLSREVAKLGHAWEAVPLEGGCPGCGAPLPKKVDFAKKRSRCIGGVVRPSGEIARLARRLALKLRPHAGDNAVVRQVLGGRIDQKWAEEKARREEAEEVEVLAWAPPKSLLFEVRSLLAWRIWKNENASEGLWRALVRAYAASYSEVSHAELCKLVRILSREHDYRVESLLALLPPDRADEVAPSISRTNGYWDREGTPATRWADRAALLADGKSVEVVDMKVMDVDGVRYIGDAAVGSVEAALRLLDSLVALGSWSRSESCGEPLYGAVPEPRRYPLADYICKRHPKLFDFFVQDEAHEAANQDSAQGAAFGRLAQLGLPTVIMTGSLMNGYAASLFHLLWQVSPAFREEFDRGDKSAFVDRYGYRKRVIQDKKDREVVAFGSQSDRVERSERDAGDAPGVLPLLLFKHLLPQTVTIHKADLALDLPPLTQSAEAVDLPECSRGSVGEQVFAEYKRMLEALKRQIKADRFQKDLVGKLFGALAELPSYLDRATEDVSGKAFEVRYPEAIGGQIVTTGRTFPASALLPKEEWLLGEVERELAEGRNVMVFGWHLDVLPRLSRIIEARTGERSPVLYADKVPTGKRQEWIDREIVKKKRRVMVTNPVPIQTGLNNLVHFATEIWHECPACNPIVYRQAIGRIDRIGQKLPTRSKYAFYGGTLQAQMRELLLGKVAISVATDGLDPESVMIAAGVGESEFLTGLSIGKQLWKMMQAA